MENRPTKREFPSNLSTKEALEYYHLVVNILCIDASIIAPAIVPSYTALRWQRKCVWTTCPKLHSTATP